ncbi:MAG: aminotransferase class III-fold pyridoxal phosphate-dependent enzyme [Selenomonadales bacterium]|nr:aminotransferase class III-fold pyridoxal phosphate-dependent enzyme [Selenomonadales bacterium]
MHCCRATESESFGRLFRGFFFEFCQSVCESRPVGLACAASKAVLDTILEDKLLDNVNEVGAYLMDAIRSLGEKYPTIIRSVRGKGFMVGIELTREGREIVQACLDAKLIINCTAGNVLRLVPSLTIGKQQVDEMITILDAVLAKQ